MAITAKQKKQLNDIPKHDPSFPQDLKLGDILSEEQADSSVGKANKPSSINSLATQSPAVDQATTNANLLAVVAKLNALIAALKV